MYAQNLGSYFACGAWQCLCKVKVVTTFTIALAIGMDFKFCTIKRAFHKLVLFLSDVRVYRLPAGCPHSLGARASVHAT